MRMPFGIRRQVEQIRAYAVMVAAEAQGSQAKKLAAVMHRSADDLELTARLALNALGPDRTRLSWPAGSPKPLQSD